MSHEDFISSRWLRTTFLTSRGLAAPTGEPLYSYRCGDAELDIVAGFLRRGIRGSGDQGRYLAALFCLYAGEWWRRNYQGGPWAWDPIFESVGLHYEWGLARDLVDRGLKFWGRPLRTSRNGREFLLSIILEAGLPLSVVRTGRGALVAFLKRVLSDLDRYGIDEDAARRLAASHGGMLPVGLRSAEIYALVVELMLVALRLRNQLPKGLSAGDAVAWLDAHQPRWRDQFPLAVDDGAARELLSGLIRETVSLRDRGRVLGSLVDRMLVRAENTWRLEAEFRMDGMIASDSMPGLASAQGSGATRARLFAAGAVEEIVPGPLALVRIGGEAGERRCRLEPLSAAKASFPLAPAREVRLRLVSGGREFDAFAAPGGEPLPPPPWTFEAIEETPDDPRRLRFLGTGSIRSRRPFVFVACPSNPAAFSEGAIIQPVGCVLGTDCELFRISGSVRLSAGDQGLKIVISTERDEELAARLVPRGTALPWRADGLAFLGTPEFWEVRDGDLGRRVRREELHWRPAAGCGSDWLQLPKDGLPAGSLDVALVRDDEIIDRLRCVVLPADASLRLLPVDARRGQIELSNVGDAQVLVERMGNDIKVEVARTADVWRVAIETGGEPPSEIIFHLVWSDGRGELHCRIPFPSRGGGFVDANGRWLKPNERLALDTLYGVRALAPSMDDATLFGWLQASDVSDRGLWVRQRFSGERSLVGLQSSFLRLLATSQDLDASIRLVVQSRGRESAQLRLSRLDLDLNIERESVSVAPAETARLTEADRAAIEVLCRPIDDFARSEEELPRAPDAHPPRWTFNGAERAGGWLIYGRVSGRYRFRPKAVLGGAHPPDGGVSGNKLSHLTRIVDYSARREAVADRLRTMADLPGADDWHEIDRALAALRGRLPLTTLDYFSLLADQPGALLMFLARAAGDDIDAILAMEDELPICWAILPLKAWFEAFGTAKKHHARLIETAGLEPHYADDVVAAALSRIEDAEPALKGTTALVRESLGQTTADDSNVLMLRQPARHFIVERLLEERRMNALRRNGDEIWPDNFDFRETNPTLPPSHLQYDARCLPLLDAPFAAAAMAVSGKRPTRPFIRAILQCREFDPVWFEEAYPLALVLSSSTPAIPAMPNS